MACPEFENLLNGRNPKHAIQCAECRALLDALSDVDSVFEAAFAGICAPGGLAGAILARTGSAGIRPRLSPVPEVLDLIGWAAILATVAFALPHFTSFVKMFLSVQ